MADILHLVVFTVAKIASSFFGIAVIVKASN